MINPLPKIGLQIKNMFEYIFQVQTYEIGFCQTIWRKSIDFRGYEYYNEISVNIIKQIQRFSEEGQDGQAVQFIDLIILIIDGLLFNIYSKNKSIDRAKIHQSIYQISSIGLQSKFQESMAPQQALALEAKNFVRALEKLAVSTEFFESLEVLLNLNDSDANKLQLTHFINSLEYMLEKEGVDDSIIESYVYNKNKIDKFLIDKQKMVDQNEIDEVNNLLFTQKLLTPRKILTVKNDTVSIQELHFTVARVYFAAYSRKRSNFKRKQFINLQYTGEDMVHNLIKYYISQITKRDNLFKETEPNDPIFDFILNYMQLLYLPSFIDFHALFDQLVVPHYKLSPPKFFAMILQTFDEFVQYFKNLPTELYNFLAQLLQTIQDSQHFEDNIPSMFPMKNLFISKFLLNPVVKQNIVKADYNMENFVAVANLFKDLFYSNTNRSYSNLPEFVEMQNKLKAVFEPNITTYDADKNIDVFSYYITDPLLRNDYSFLFAYIQQIKILPLDQKDFVIEPFVNFLPKRGVIIDLTKKAPDPDKQAELDREKEKEEKKKRGEIDIDDDMEYQEKQEQGSSPKFDSMQFQIEKADKFTQTEEDIKMDEYEQNFDDQGIDKSELSEISQKIEDGKNISKRMITISDQQELDFRQQDHLEKQQQHQQKQEIEIMELRKQIDDIQLEFQDQLQQNLLNHQNKLALQEHQNNQLRLENNILRNDRTLLNDKIIQLQREVEQLVNQKGNLKQQVRELKSEKQLLISHFQNIQIDQVQEKPRFKSFDDHKDEFDDLCGQIAQRQNQVIQVQSQYEIQKKALLRKL
ncbi:hypothetical protein pb186bvf_021089 [Paramecium bursaria]